MRHENMDLAKQAGLVMDFSTNCGDAVLNFTSTEFDFKAIKVVLKPDTKKLEKAIDEVVEWYLASLEILKPIPDGTEWKISTLANTSTHMDSLDTSTQNGDLNLETAPSA